MASIGYGWRCLGGLALVLSCGGITGKDEPKASSSGRTGEEKAGGSSLGAQPAEGGSISAVSSEGGRGATGSAAAGSASLGGSTGTTAGGSTGAAGTPSSGGAGSSAGPDRLVLAPDTLVFFAPESARRGAAVTGYDPAARACATLEFFGPTNELALGAYCVTGASDTIEVAVQLNQEEPCEPPPAIGSWQEATAAEGCIEYSGLTGRELDLVDAVVETQGDAFTGSITVDNRSVRSPVPVTFGLSYFTDTPETVYVQTHGDTTGPGWVSISSGGEPLTAFPACLPECGSGEELDSCNERPGDVEAVVVDGNEWAGFASWDGNIYEIRWDERCQARAAAPDGTYQVAMCFSYGFDAIGSGDWIVDPICVSKDFAIPTDSGLISLDYRG